jgi:hypothetical protein
MSKKTFAAMAAAALIIAPINHFSSRPIVLPPYAGGSPAKFLDLANRLEATGRKIIIRYRCDSACAILASLPSACLDEGADIGLHHPYLVLLVNDQVFHMGPSDSPEFFDNVTPEISSKIKELNFNWDDPSEILFRITYETAPEFGINQC